MVRVGHKLGGLKRKARREGWADMIRSAADERAVLNGCTFDERAAAHAVEFFPAFLRHFKGRSAGEPFILLPWQRDEIIRPLFGWKGPDGFRRYKKAYVEIPKKNGKSTLCAGVGLYMLAGDGEAGAEVYSAGVDIKQAKICHDAAVAMVDASPELSSVLRVNRSTNQISYAETGSFYRALTGVPRRNQGWDGHCCIVDELHGWLGRELFDALRWMFAARDQPLLFVITTAGDDPVSLCKEEHDAAAACLAGTRYQEDLLAYIRAAEETDNVHKVRTWKAANPSLGATISMKSFRADYEDAKKSVGSLAAWKRYRLNVWSTGVTGWIEQGKWRACKRRFALDELLGRPCFGGLDLSKTRDTTALVLAFPPERPRQPVTFVPFFWLPEATAAAWSDRVPYLDWAAAGELFVTPGEVCDYRYIKSTIAGTFRGRELDVMESHGLAEGLAKLFDFQVLHFDPWQAEQLTQEIEAECDIERKEFRQVIGNFCEPCEELERRIIAGEVRHNGHRLLDWQVGNTEIYTDPNGSKRPVKASPDSPKKIDGVVAMIMAFAALLDGGESMYEAEGFRVV